MLEKDHLKLKEESEHPTIRVADESEAGAEPSKLVDPKPEASTESDGRSASVTMPENNVEPLPPDSSNTSSEALSSSHPSHISEQELLGLAMHPHASESDWLKACAELNRREQLPPVPSKDKKSGNTVGLFVAISAIILATGIACGFYFAQSHKPGQPAVALKIKFPAKPTDYMHSSAGIQKYKLKLRARVVVANAIAENEWSDSEAAKNLHVDPQVISDLLRDIPSKISLEQLSEMAMLMGKPVGALISNQQNVVYTLSSPPESELRESLAYYTRAIGLGNNSASEFRERARVHDRLKQFDLAIADCDRCLEMDPSNLDLRETRAMVYWHAGKNEDALKDFAEILRRSPNYDCYQNRAIVYGSMGDYKNALKDSSEAIARMNEQRPGPYSNRADWEEKLGMTKEAIADYKKAIESDPTYKHAYERIDALQKLSSK